MRKWIHAARGSRPLLGKTIIYSWNLGLEDSGLFAFGETPSHLPLRALLVTPLCRGGGKKREEELVKLDNRADFREGGVQQRVPGLDTCRLNVFPTEVQS